MILKHKLGSMFLCLIFLISLTSSSPTELTNITFSTYISSNSRTFLYFYSPSCKYCHLLEPEIKKLPDLVGKLGIEGSQIAFARIDGNQYVELAEKYGVDRFPTLFLFDEGFVVPYDQARNATEISNWIKDYFSNRIIDISNEEMNNKPRPFIALHNPSEQAIKVFNQALFGFIGVNAYRTTNNIGQRISIYTRDMATIQYKGQLERIQVKKWIQDNVKLAIIPIVNKVVESTLQNDKNIPVLVFVLSEEDRLKQQKYESFVRFCQSTKQKLICGQILPSYDTFKGSHGFFQVSDTNKSFIGLVQQKMNIAYRMDIPFQHINQQNLAKFVDGCLKGEIKRIVDNVPPEHIAFQDVVQLNSQNFDQNVLKNDYAFVNFYRGNESVSKLFSRPYESFAKIVSEEKELQGTIISAFDCNKDEQFCAKYKFDFYPTLILFIHGIPVQYDKTKKLPEIPNLMQFIASKRSAKLVRLESKEQIKNVAKPAFVIYAKQSEPLFQALPAIVSSIDSYFIQTNTDETKLELILTDELSQIFKGDLNSFSIKNWLRKQTRQLLSNMMQDNPDKALMNAVSKKEKILFILDMEKQTSDKNRLALASIAKNLDICGAYADGQHPGFPQLVQWVGINTPSKSTLIIVDIEKDRKYAYPGEIQTMTSESVQRFIDDIKNGKIKKIQQQVNKPQRGERQIKDQDQNKEQVITEQL